ncbi:hypothetical protein BG000_009028 [Podila horticola]|nr:hypothetical protein BG000_009028 [Podila horticola]
MTSPLSGARLIESMVESIVQATKEASGADKENKGGLDRALILAQIEKVRDQYQPSIDANPWLKEQLSTGYWD